MKIGREVRSWRKEDTRMERVETRMVRGICVWHTT